MNDKKESTMRSSWLVQRLEKPWSLGQIKDNPFAFGGGLRNGGLSSEAMDLLRGVFSFDYMGAAEFEFGAVPKALQEIAKNIDLETFEASSFTFPLKKVEKGWRDKSAEEPEGDVTIYVICSKADVKEVQTRIKGWAFKHYDKKFALKEMTMLPQVLRPDSDWTPRVVGWLELDNGFFFFIDKEMWEKTAELFGLET